MSCHNKTCKRIVTLTGILASFPYPLLLCTPQRNTGEIQAWDVLGILEQIKPIFWCLIIIVRHSTPSLVFLHLEANKKQRGQNMSYSDCSSYVFHFVRGTSRWENLTQHHPNISIKKTTYSNLKKRLAGSTPNLLNQETGGQEWSSHLCFEVPWITYMTILKKGFKVLAPKRTGELHGLLRYVNLHYTALNTCFTQEPHRSWGVCRTFYSLLLYLLLPLPRCFLNGVYTVDTYANSRYCKPKGLEFKNQNVSCRSWTASTDSLLTKTCFSCMSHKEMSRNFGVKAQS